MNLSTHFNQWAIGPVILFVWVPFNILPSAGLKNIVHSSAKRKKWLICHYFSLFNCCFVA